MQSVASCLCTTHVMISQRPPHRCPRAALTGYSAFQNLRTVRRGKRFAHPSAGTRPPRANGRVGSSTMLSCTGIAMRSSISGPNSNTHTGDSEASSPVPGLQPPLPTRHGGVAGLIRLLAGGDSTTHSPGDGKRAEEAVRAQTPGWSVASQLTGRPTLPQPHWAGLVAFSVVVSHKSCLTMRRCWAVWGWDGMGWIERCARASIVFTGLAAGRPSLEPGGS
jgi:hypothetical protein